MTSSSPCVSFANSIRSFSYFGDKCPVASRRMKSLGDSVVGLAGLFTLGAPQETCHAGSGPVRGILVSSLVVKCKKRDNFSRGEPEMMTFCNNGFCYLRMRFGAIPL